MATELKVPSAGESVSEVHIAEWLCQEGDFVQLDQPVVELETDKASMEVPAPVSGVVTKQLVAAGDMARVGDVLAMIDETAEAPQQGAAAKSSGGTKSASSGGADGSTTAVATASPAGENASKAAGGHVMPAARRLAHDAGVSAADVPGSGPGGRVLKEDVQRFIADGPNTAAGSTAAPQAAPVGGAREEDVVPMSMLRRRIAERLVAAQQTAAMLTTFNEIDMSAVLALRKQRNEEFEKRYGIKLGFMSIFVKAAIDALKRFPAVNAEIREQNLVYKNYYDIGVAVSTERGLVVPVVRNAERLSFAEIELAIADLARRGRDGKLTLDELQGGTFTISNGGVFGSLMSTPILNPPQSGILGLHALQERPVARDGQVVIRPMMYVALTYDHRVIDGRESVSFLKRIKECVEDPTRMLIES